MSKGRKNVVWLIVPLCLAAALVVWRGEIQNLWQNLMTSPPPVETRKVPPPAPEPEGMVPDTLPSPSVVERSAVPDEPPEAGAVTPEELAATSSPPLPEIDPASGQEERRRAFRMKESIDHIVRRDETFELDGKAWSLEGILSGLGEGAETRELMPFIKDRPIGPAVRRPIQEPLPPHLRKERYYGVRVVRPSENIWTIHYGIFREYMERRDIHIARAADRPLADGRSSGVGRLLKFMESVVFVYNVHNNRMVENIHLIYPHTVIVFFNISELFSAFDKLSHRTLLSLRYVESGLVIEKPEQTVPLMERRSFRH